MDFPDADAIIRAGTDKNAPSAGGSENGAKLEARTAEDRGMGHKRLLLVLLVSIVTIAAVSVGAVQAVRYLERSEEAVALGDAGGTGQIVPATVMVLPAAESSVDALRLSDLWLEAAALSAADPSDARLTTFLIAWDMDGAIVSLLLEATCADGRIVSVEGAPALGGTMSVRVSAQPGNGNRSGVAPLDGVLESLDAVGLGVLALAAEGELSQEEGWLLASDERDLRKMGQTAIEEIAGSAPLALSISGGDIGRLTGEQALSTQFPSQGFYLWRARFSQTDDGSSTGGTAPQTSMATSTVGRPIAYWLVHPAQD